MATDLSTPARSALFSPHGLNFTIALFSVLAIHSMIIPGTS
jgi:hypothetical protein